MRNAVLLSLLLLAPLAGCGSSKPTSGGVAYVDQIAAARKEPDAAVRARRLTVIGYQQGSKSNDMGGARRTLDLASTACGEIADATSKASMYTLLGDAYARLGERTDSGRALDKATEAAKVIELPGARVSALAAAAAVYGAALKNAAEAEETFKLAQQAADGIEDVPVRASALVDVGKAYLKTEQPDAAASALQSALELARKVEDSKPRSKLLGQIGAAQLGLPDAAAGEATVAEAIQAADAVTNPYSQVYALADIAEALIDAKRPDQAKELLSRAEGQVKTIPEVDLQGEAEQRVRTLMKKLPAKS